MNCQNCGKNIKWSERSNAYIPVVGRGVVGTPMIICTECNKKIKKRNVVTNNV